MFRRTRRAASLGDALRLQLRRLPLSSDLPDIGSRVDRVTLRIGPTTPDVRFSLRDIGWTWSTGKSGVEASELPLVTPARGESANRITAETPADLVVLAMLERLVHVQYDEVVAGRARLSTKDPVSLDAITAVAMTSSAITTMSESGPDELRAAATLAVAGFVARRDELVAARERAGDL